ncbi:MAG: tetratricopeptide repeat protein [Chitinophagaceae bacterium]
MQSIDIAHNLVNKAHALMDLGRYAQAETLLHQVLATIPNDIDALELLCRCKLYLDKLPECISIGRNLLGIYPDNPTAFFLLAEAHAYSGEPATAEEFIRMALKNQPDNAFYHAALSNYLLMQHDEPSAVQEAVNGLKHDPENVPALSALGLAYFHLDNYEDALISFQQALKLEPNNTYLLHNIGLIFREADNFDTARELFRDALRNNPNFNPAALDDASIGLRKLWIYRLHYKLVRFFNQSHVIQLSYCILAFFAALYLYELSKTTYTILSKLFMTTGWIFLLTSLAIFVIPPISNIPAFFQEKYKQAFKTRMKIRCLSIGMLYITSIVLLVMGWLTSYPQSKNWLYGSLLSLITTLLFYTVAAIRIGKILLIFLFIAYCTALYFLFAEKTSFTGFYIVYILFVPNILTILLHAFKKISL